jgi:hypothetical protein
LPLLIRLFLTRFPMRFLSSFKLWKGEMLRARKRRRTALRRALLYRWRIWRAYLRRYKADVVEDMDVELDRKLESLAKLQQLLQAHNNGTAPPPMSTPGTPAPMRRGDSFSSPAPMKRGDSFSSPVGRSSKIVLSSVTEAAEEKSSDKRSGSPSPAMTPSGSVIPGAPPLSPGAMLQVRSGSGKFFLRDRGNVLPTLARQPSGGFASGGGGSPQMSIPAAAPLSAKEIKKQQEQKLGQRKKMLEDVDNSIRETLSSMTLRPQEVRLPSHIQHTVLSFHGRICFFLLIFPLVCFTRHTGGGPAGAAADRLGGLTGCGGGRRVCAIVQGHGGPDQGGRSNRVCYPVSAKGALLAVLRARDCISYHFPFPLSTISHLRIQRHRRRMSG